MSNIKLIAPAGRVGLVQSGGGNYTIGSDRTITVPSAEVPALLAAGFQYSETYAGQIQFIAPIAAELVSIKAAATPANGTITIAAQPDYPRKFAVDIHIGTTTTTAITAGSITLVGIDQDGNAITEVVSLIKTSSATVKTTNAFAHLTSGTVADYAAAGSGTGNTLGIGVAADLGIPTAVGVIGFAVHKAGVIALTTGAVGTPSDEAVGTVDATARTVAPTTAPDASKIHIFNFSYSMPG